MILRHGVDDGGASSPHPERKAAASPNLSTLDLNLLRVFDAMIEERSATRAGHRLGLSQSAVSHAMARLRLLLDDELFVKGTDGMVPTAKARAIGPRLHAAMTDLHVALAYGAFEPSQSEHRFTIAADPYTRAVLLPPLIARIRREAPAVELRIRPGFHGATEALDSGRLDLAIGGYRRAPERFGLQELLQERHVWAVRNSHAAAGQTLTMQRLAALPRLIRLVSDDEDAGDPGPDLGRGLERRSMQDDGGALDRALAPFGRHAAVRLTITDSHAALAIVGETDLAALVPARIAHGLARHFGVTLLKPPYESPPVPLSMIWHVGQGASAAAAWLRTQVMDVAAGLR